MKINNDEELKLAGELLDKLWDIKPWQSQYKEREELVEAISAYEDEHFPVPPPEPLDAICFRMQAQNIEPGDLAHLFGSKEAVIAIITGEQELTDEIVFKMYTRLGIPLRSLLGHDDGITIDEFIRDEERRLHRFKKYWLSKYKDQSIEFLPVAEYTDEWFENYEIWSGRRG